MKKVVDKKKGELNAKLNFPNVQLTLSSNSPISSLRELNKILHTLKAIEFNREFYEFEEEDPLLFKLNYLSEEVKSNNNAMDFIRTVAKIEENVKYKKIVVENKKILDFQSNQYTSSVDRVKLKAKINLLCSGYEKANYVLVHVMGDWPDEEKISIIDQIKNKIPHAEVKSLFTKKNLLDKTVIECVFFGPFSEDEQFY